MHFFRQFVWAEKLTASMFLHVWWKSEMRNMFMKVICWFMKVILQLQLEKHFVRTKFGQQENNVKIMLTLTDAHCTTTRTFLKLLDIENRMEYVSLFNNYTWIVNKLSLKPPNLQSGKRYNDITIFVWTVIWQHCLINNIR